MDDMEALKIFGGSVLFAAIMYGFAFFS